MRDDQVLLDGDEPGLGGGVTLAFRLQEGFGGRSHVLVEPDTAASRTSQQFVNGHSQGLPEDIPQRDFDGADGAIQNGSPTPARVTVHSLPQQLDLGRILTHQEPFILLDSLSNGRFLAGDRPLAQPRNPLVGQDLAEHPIHRSNVDDKRLDAGDLQVQPAGLGREQQWVACLSGGPNGGRGDEVPAVYAHFSHFYGHLNLPI